MTTSTPTRPEDRLPIGQLLVRLLHHLRTDVFQVGRSRGSKLRFPHLQIIGNLIGVDGIRLTDLAGRATLSLAACSELVNELVSLGYLERRPDPTDGRAKLIVPTPLGQQLLDGSQAAIRKLEERWAAHCESGEFEAACQALDTLLHALDAKSQPTPPGPDAGV